jgi:hypothetical protein
LVVEFSFDPHGGASGDGEPSDRATPALIIPEGRYVPLVAERGVVRLALAGDTMLGRSVGEAITRTRRALLDDDVITAAAEADVFVLNSSHRLL